MAPSKNHSIVQANLILLYAASQFHGYPELSLADGKVPDIAIYKDDELVWSGIDEVKVDKKPDIVLEILSPKQPEGELLKKIQEFLDSGVDKAYLFNPSQKIITEYTDSVDDGRVMLGRELFLGIEIKKLFTRLLKVQIVDEA